MILFFPDNFKKKVIFLAYYQIFGGVLGVLLTLWILVNSTQGGLTFLILLITLGLYSYSMYCGKLLIDGKIKNGLYYSTINQSLQAINFAFAGFAFKFMAGINLSIGIDYSQSLKFIYYYSLSQFQMNINSNKETVTVGINLIAFSLIFIIGNLIEEFKKESTSSIPE